MDLNGLQLPELREIAKAKGVKNIIKYRKADLRDLLKGMGVELTAPEPPPIAKATPVSETVIETIIETVIEPIIEEKPEAPPLSKTAAMSSSPANSGRIIWRGLTAARWVRGFSK